MDNCRLGDVQQATAECGPVLRHIFAGGPAAGRTDTQLLQAHCVVAVPESVQPEHSLRHASRDRRAETDDRLLIDYYKMNID